MGGKGSGRKKKLRLAENTSPDSVYMPPDKPLVVEKASMKAKIESLKFIRIYDLNLIPKYLLEQVKPRNFDLNEIYAMAPNYERDPLTLLYALTNEEYKIKGFLWCRLNTIFKTIDIEVLSVDREYQDRGQVILKARDFMVPLMKKTGFRLRGITSRPKALSRFGFKKTKEVIIEMEVET